MRFHSQIQTKSAIGMDTRVLVCLCEWVGVLVLCAIIELLKHITHKYTMHNKLWEPEREHVTALATRIRKATEKKNIYIWYICSAVLSEHSLDWNLRFGDASNQNWCGVTWFNIQLAKASKQQQEHNNDNGKITITEKQQNKNGRRKKAKRNRNKRYAPADALHLGWFGFVRYILCEHMW